MKARPWACGLLLLPLCLGEPPVLFLKTHKTGSTTVAAIVHRYAESRGLACRALPTHRTSSTSARRRRRARRRAGALRVLGEPRDLAPATARPPRPGRAARAERRRESRALPQLGLYGVGGVARDGAAPIAPMTMLEQPQRERRALAGLSTHETSSSAGYDTSPCARGWPTLTRTMDRAFARTARPHRRTAAEPARLGAGGCALRDPQRRRASACRKGERAPASASADDAQLYAAAERASRQRSPHSRGRTAAIERAAALGDAGARPRTPAAVNATVTEEASDAAPALSLGAAADADGRQGGHARARRFMASSRTRSARFSSRPRRLAVGPRLP